MSKKLKVFTLYWINGDRNYIFGNTIEDAFNSTYGGGALKAVDWYDSKASDTHYYENGKWEKRQDYLMPKKITEFSLNMVPELLKIFDKARDITVEFENKDMLVIAEDFGSYGDMGTIHNIKVLYGEYCQGSYSGEDDDKEDHHYMVTGIEYYDPVNIADAMEAFVIRLISNTPSKPYGLKSNSLGEIAVAQPQFDQTR